MAPLDASRPLAVRASIHGDVTEQQIRAVSADLARLPVARAHLSLDVEAVTHIDQLAVRALMDVIEGLDTRVLSQALVASSGPVLRALDAVGLFERAPRARVQEPRHLRSAAATPTETVMELARAAAAGHVAGAPHLLTANVVWRFANPRGEELLATGRSAVARLLDRRANEGEIAHTVEAQGMVMTGGRGPAGDRGAHGRGHVLWTTGGQVVVGVERISRHIVS